MATIRYQRTNAKLDVYVYHNTDDNSVRVTQLDGADVAITTMPLHDHTGKLVAVVVTFPNGETMQLGDFPQDEILDVERDHG